MPNPKPIEHKQSIGTMSINIEPGHINGRKLYILTFFFEHGITCKTYSRTIERTELVLHNLFLENRPGALPKYLGNPPCLYISDTSGTNDVLTAIFAHPAHSIAQKLTIDIPADISKPVSRPSRALNEPRSAAIVKMIQIQSSEVNEVD